MTTLSLHKIFSSLKFMPIVAFSTGLVASSMQTALAKPFLRTGTNYPDVLENERMICLGHRGVGDLSFSECQAVARDFYREIHFQITDFTGGSITVIRPTSIEMIPDGSGFAKGLLEAFPVFFVGTGGNPYALSIENAFAYQPIDNDTIAFFGAPLFTNFDGVHLDHPAFIKNAQLSIYRRIKGGLNDPTCRSVSNPLGDTCWGIMTELWTYQAPLGSGVSSINPQVPATTFPGQLEDSRIVCDSQSGDATTTDLVWLQKCKLVAQEFYDQFRLDIRNVTGGDGMFNVPASIEMIPDGSGYVSGVLADNLYASVTNGNTRTLNVENAFTYKPIDPNTVIVIGEPLLTVSKEHSLTPSYIQSMQLSVYRRTELGLHAPGACRSESRPFGITCWVLINKLWTYQQPLGSGVSFTP